MRFSKTGRRALLGATLALSFGVVVRTLAQDVGSDPSPEDMVFIGADGRIASIAENTVPQSLAIVSSGTPVAATLELQGGLTEKLGITVGDKVTSKALPAGEG